MSDFIVYLRQLVDERRRHPGDPEADVLTRLLQGDAEGVLSETELLHNCIFLLNAGHETTTNLIGNGLHALLRHPGELQRLVADPALINTAVEELLRYESPLQLNNRRLTAELEIGGQGIPSAPSSRCASARPTATRRSSPTPTGWTWRASRTITLPSARARTPVRA